jgi:[lysine-biosynthesis-protein LysW]--L-2-aminoadipate ligase
VGRQPVVALVASRVRFEERCLLEAIERRGVPHEVIDAREFWAELRPGPPRFEVALARELAQTRNLYAARLLESQGVEVVNRAEVISTCGDKLLTSLALQRAGVPAPRTALALTPGAALEALEAIGYPAVLKPLTGSWGRLCARVADRDAAEAVLEHRAALPNPQQHVVYVQEHVDKPSRDIRVIVVGGEPICAVYREADGWRTNAALGARSLPCELRDDLAGLAAAAAAAVGGGVLGVDLLEDRAGGLWVGEVNHTVEFRGAATATGVDIAGRVVAHALERAAT